MDNSNSAFSEFNDMSTEELYEFLYRNTDNPDVDALQLDKITAALEVYTARVQEDLAPPCTAEEAVSAVFANISAADPVPTVPIRASRRIWRRVASVAAVVAISFSLITAASYATGAPLWSAVIEWTQDAFQFIWQEENHQEIIPGDPTLLMEKYGVTVGGVPNWVPDGYVFVKYYDYAEQPLLDAISVSYQREDGWLIKFRATAYDPDNHSYYEQSGNARIYRTNGIQYYIYPNGDRWSAVWMEDGCECSLHGKFTKRQLKNTLKAMHKEGEALG